MGLPTTLASLPTDFVVPLSHMGVVQCVGEQSADYLHGQITIDVKSFAQDAIRRTAHCDFKGKAWALPYLCRHAENYWLLTHKGALEASLAQLQKYGVFSKISLSDESDNIALFFARGEHVDSFINDTFGACPDVDHTQTSEHGLVAKLALPAGYLLALTAQGQTAWANWCEKSAIATFDTAVFEALCIAAGVPDVAGQNVNQFVPQMMNLQLLDGIDFKKGCYMGQEVVARTRYLGRNKRAAYALKATTQSLPATSLDIGVKVDKQLGENWRSGGTVLRSAILGEEVWVLAVLANDTEASAVFRLSGTEQPEFHVEPLPYVLNE